MPRSWSSTRLANVSNSLGCSTHLGIASRYELHVRSASYLSSIRPSEALVVNVICEVSKMNTRPNRGRDHRTSCSYCSNLSSTKDHAPPRCLFRHPIGNDAKIVTLPCCAACNVSFSKDESIVKAVLANVSFEPDLMGECTEGGRVDRALRFDKSLKQAISDAYQADGRMNVEPFLDSFERVVRKSVVGVYFGVYGITLPFGSISVISIDHARLVSSEHLFNLLRRSATPDLSVGNWPEVRPNPRRLVKAARHWPEGSEHQLMTPVKWLEIQPGAFRVAFTRGAQNKAICLLEIRNTVLAAVECPWPSNRGPIRRGRKKDPPPFRCDE